MTILEAIEHAIEQVKESSDLVTILYISLEPNDYLQVQDEVGKMSGKDKPIVNTLHSIPIYFELAKSHLVTFDTGRIIRHKQILEDVKPSCSGCEHEFKPPTYGKCLYCHDGDTMLNYQKRKELKK